MNSNMILAVVHS